MNYYFDVLKKYAVFEGRARRKEYWMYVLFDIIAMVILAIIGTVINFPYLASIYGLAVLLPSLAVAIRRLQDTGRSGWWIFITLVPAIGSIWLIVLLATDSQPGQNQYGPNPKGL